MELHQKFTGWPENSCVEDPCVCFSKVRLCGLAETHHKAVNLEKKRKFFNLQYLLRASQYQIVNFSVLLSESRDSSTLPRQQKPPPTRYLAPQKSG